MPAASHSSIIPVSPHWHHSAGSWEGGQWKWQRLWSMMWRGSRGKALRHKTAAHAIHLFSYGKALLEVTT